MPTANWCYGTEGGGINPQPVYHPELGCMGGVAEGRPQPIHQRKNCGGCPLRATWHSETKGPSLRVQRATP